eukprot:s151_g3.t1
MPAHAFARLPPALASRPIRWLPARKLLHLRGFASTYPRLLAATLARQAQVPSALGRGQLVHVWESTLQHPAISSDAVAALLQDHVPTLASSMSICAAWLESLAASGQSHSSHWPLLLQAARCAMEAEMQEFSGIASRLRRTYDRLTGQSHASHQQSLQDLARIVSALTLAAPRGVEGEAAAFAAAGSLAKALRANSSEESWRRIAWACASAGHAQLDVFGDPPIQACSASSTAVWKALERRMHVLPESVLTQSPFPLLKLDGWMSEEEKDILVAAADAGHLWRASPLAVEQGPDAPPTRTSESAVLAESRDLPSSTSAAETPDSPVSHGCRGRYKLYEMRNNSFYKACLPGIFSSYHMGVILQYHKVQACLPGIFSSYHMGVILQYHKVQACLLGIRSSYHMGVILQYRKVQACLPGIRSSYHMGVILQYRKVQACLPGIRSSYHMGVILQYRKVQACLLGIRSSYHMGVILQYRKVQACLLGILSSYHMIRCQLAKDRTYLKPRVLKENMEIVNFRECPLRRQQAPVRHLNSG